MAALAAGRVRDQGNGFRQRGDRARRWFGNRWRLTLNGSGGAGAKRRNDKLLEYGRHVFFLGTRDILDCGANRRRWPDAPQLIAGGVTSTLGHGLQRRRRHDRQRRRSSPTTCSEEGREPEAHCAAGRGPNEIASNPALPRVSARRWP